MQIISSKKKNQKKIKVKTIAKRIGEKITFKKASIVGSVTTVV